MPYVYMRFTFDKRWTCDFVNQFTQRRVRTLRFTDAEKIRELAQRGKHLQICRARTTSNTPSGMVAEVSFWNSANFSTTG
jgi:hypothetical protein